MGLQKVSGSLIHLFGARHCWRGSRDAAQYGAGNGRGVPVFTPLMKLFMSLLIYLYATDNCYRAVYTYTNL